MLNSNGIKNRPCHSLSCIKKVQSWFTEQRHFYIDVTLWSKHLRQTRDLWRSGHPHNTCSKVKQTNKQTKSRESHKVLKQGKFLKNTSKIRTGEVEMFLTQHGDTKRQVTCLGRLDDICATSTPPPDWHLANEFRIHVIGLYPIFNLFILIANLSLSLSKDSPCSWDKIVLCKWSLEGHESHSWLIRIDYQPLMVWFIKLQHEFYWV